MLILVLDYAYIGARLRLYWGYIMPILGLYYAYIGVRLEATRLHSERTGADRIGAVINVI
jgi:hypothetical protein